VGPPLDGSECQVDGIGEFRLGLLVFELDGARRERIGGDGLRRFAADVVVELNELAEKLGEPALEAARIGQ
jgi:hypothetical protein